MRILIACGVVGLALGLAAQWLPRAPGAEASADVASSVRMQPLQSRVPVSQSSDGRTSSAPVARDGAAAPASGVVDAGARAIRGTLAADHADAPALSVASAADVERESVAQLIAAGFTRDRALEIIQRKSQLRRTSIEREFAATGVIRPFNASSPAAVEQQLRRELGDDEYEKYLGAIGQATRIRVGSVEADSAAANAGILSGDLVLTYAGRRVFNLRDLNALMLQTPEGETVQTTVVRSGQTIQLYVTGGALGISQSIAH